MCLYSRLDELSHALQLELVLKSCHLPVLFELLLFVCSWCSDRQGNKGVKGDSGHAGKLGPKGDAGQSGHIGANGPIGEKVKMEYLRDKQCSMPTILADRRWIWEEGMKVGWGRIEDGKDGLGEEDGVGRVKIGGGSGEWLGEEDGVGRDEDGWWGWVMVGKEGRLDWEGVRMCEGGV